MIESYFRQLKYLDAILRNGKIPHAFLFYGPDTASQKMIAQAFVFRLNAPEASWADFLKGDSLADKIRQDIDPDVYVIKRLEGKKEIGIAQIRALKDFVSRTPLNLKTKAVIVENAQSLGEEPWNALLKTLEEPSENTVIVLISAQLNGIPKTISSRTLNIPFWNIGPSGKKKPGSDIIIKKLAGVSRLAITDKFNLAEEMAASDNTLEVLDDWLIFLHSQLFDEACDLAKVSTDIEIISKAKHVLNSTNANLRLVLENLFLQL